MRLPTRLKLQLLRHFELPHMRNDNTFSEIWSCCRHLQQSASGQYEGVDSVDAAVVSRPCFGLIRCSTRLDTEEG